MNLSETKVWKVVCTFGSTALFGVLLCLAVEARAALQELSAEFYRGDGSLADPTKNSRGEMLTEQHYIYFQHSADGQPGQTSRVTVPDGFKLDNINLANVWTTWSGVAGLDDSCAVTLVGSPSKLWLQDWKYPTIEAGRTLTLDGVRIEQTNMLDFAQLSGGLKLDGRLLMKNGSAYKATSPGMYSTAGATGELTVKDSDLEFFSFAPDADAKLRLLSGTLTAPRWTIGTGCFQTNVQIRNAQVRVNANLTHPSFFPSGTNGLFECLLVSDNSFTPVLSQGEQIALRGKAMATNNTGATVSKCILTNDVAFYGRGTLNTGYLRVMNGKTADFDLANLELGYRIDAMANPDGVTDAPNVNFRNGINLRMYDTRPGGTRAVDFSIPVDFYGPVTLDSRDIYSYAVRSLSFNHTLSFHDRSSVEYRGNVTVGYRLQPVRYGRYAVADDSTLTESDYNTSAPCWRRTHDYVLGRNAVHNVTTYEEVVEATGEVSVDPTAKLIAGVPANVGNDLYPLFCSLSGRPLGCTLAVQNEAEGCSIKWVGGCAYYSNGLKDYGGKTTMGSWLGAEDG